MKKIIYIIAILLFVIAIVGASAVYSKLTETYKVSDFDTDKVHVVEDSAAVEGLDTGNAAVDEPLGEFPSEDFTVYDADGNEVNLSDFHGKPIVVNFWATWCPPCKSELPAFEDAYAAYGEDVAFLMVNLTDGARDTVEGVQKFVKDGSYTFPVYYDTSYDAAETYGVYSIPMTIFYDAGGNITQGYIGALNESVITENLEAITK